MRILVTGGAGFIGSNFLQLAVPAHPQIEFLNIDKLTYAGNPLSLAGLEQYRNYSFARVDVAVAEDVERVFKDFAPTAVVHFAAESHVDRSLHEPDTFVRTNVNGTLHLLEACRRYWRGQESVFHHVSTDEVYGSLGPAGAFTEESRYDPSSPYSASKAASDHLVRAYHRTFGVPVKITNCSNNYGPRQFPEKLVPLMILNALARKPLPVYGEGANVRDWLYVDDHCRAIWIVLREGRVGETYNVGGGSELRNIDVVRAICRGVAQATQSPVEELEALITFVPDRPGHDLRYAIDASKIRRELAWQPLESFETGLRKTIDWYLQNTAWIDSIRTGAYLQWIQRNYDDRGRAQ